MLDTWILYTDLQHRLDIKKHRVCRGIAKPASNQKVGKRELSSKELRLLYDGSVISIVDVETAKRGRHPATEIPVTGAGTTAQEHRHL